MHLFDVSKNFYGGNAIVSSHLPLAVGMALASKKRKTISCCFFGEGGCRRRISRSDESRTGSCVICL
jgi:TPP-dependent pyruvate/acetoin dehydrogenase alpha subunit